MKTIQLKEFGIGRYSDVSPFPLGDLELDIQGIPNYNGDFRFVAEINGVKCAESTLTAAQRRVIIPCNKLNAGRLSCRVIHYMQGKEVRIFKIEDLLITDLNAGLSAYPEIANMTAKIDTLESALAESQKTNAALLEALKTETEKLNEIEKRLLTLEANNDIFNN